MNSWSMSVQKHFMRCWVMLPATEISVTEVVARRPRVGGVPGLLF